jgi:DNA-binding IclR family transcriptional regulator
MTKALQVSAAVPAVPALPAVPAVPPAATAARERRQRVQAAETGLAVLKGLADLGGRSSLTALSAHVAESPAKVHRYLASLMEQGFVLQDAASQHYYLGTAAIQIGLAAMRQADPIRAAEPGLIRLRESLSVTSFVAVMGNKGPIIVRFEEPGLPVTVNVRAGSVMSMLWSATGRAFLGLLDDAQVLALAEQELATSPPDVRATLDAADPIGQLRREVREARCASVKDTYMRGISAVAAPVYDYTGRVCAVLTALGATGGFDPAVDGPIATAVRREAQAASAILGHPKPAPQAER